MGLIEMPSIEDYWSTTWISKTAFFSRVFTRDRFEAIFWLLHLSHEEEGVPAKRVDKVKPLIDLLIPRFQANYVPSQCLAVDETMVGFRGRFGPKQYMPKKPVKYGIKAFTLADSAEGYVLNILLYTGSETLGFVNPEYNTLPIPAQVVVHLMEPFLQKGHHVYTDRYYTSIPLAKKLKEEGTAFTGTVMRNRVGLPDAIRFGTRLSDDEIRAFRDDDNILAMEWRAAKKKISVIMVSTDDTAQTCEVTSRSTGRQHIKPKVVDSYNQCMNGVDRADQHTVYYAFVRKCRKWWRKVFFWLLEVTVVNSYVLYSNTNSHRLTHLEYRRRIVDSLAARHIMTAPPRRVPGRPRKRSRDSYMGDPERLNGKTHLLGRREPHNCVVCSKEKRHRSIYYCTTCTSQPSLCPYPCFEKYHTLASYT